MGIRTLRKHKYKFVKKSNPVTENWNRYSKILENIQDVLLILRYIFSLFNRVFILINKLTEICKNFKTTIKIQR